MTWTEDELPWQRLASAMIEQAVFDYQFLKATGGIERLQKRKQTLWRQKGTGRYATREKIGLSDAESVISFFKGEYFETLARFVRLNPDAIRSKLEAGTIARTNRRL